MISRYDSQKSHSLKRTGGSQRGRRHRRPVPARAEVPGAARRHRGHRVPSPRDVSAPKHPSGSPGRALPAGTGSTLRDGFGALGLRRCRQSLELPEGCFWPVELPWKVSPAPSFVGNPPCSSQNRTMVWVRRDLEDHPV